MNSIRIISPYKYHGQWVFDDPQVGLVREPFVAGADTLIDRATADILDAEGLRTAVLQYAVCWTPASPRLAA